MPNRTRIWAEVDYEKDGKQVAWLHLHHSVTRSAYGDIMIPVAVIKNGKGPSVLLTAGNHGDEYEGQIALCKFIREIDPGQIQGRIVVLPALNMPAALTGTRVSPLDQGNLNRLFPGDPDGTPTQQIAYYVDSVLLPMVEYWHDYHAGGSSLAYLPFASMRQSEDRRLNDRTMTALKAFGAPIGLVWQTSIDGRQSLGAGIRRGVVTLGGEFGGTGDVTIEGVRIIERGLRRELAHLGVIAASSGDTPTPSTRLMEVRNKSYYVYAPEPGLFEPFTELGDNVKAGQPCGQVHFVDNPARAPVPCHFKTDGMVICKRHFGRVERGDCVVHLATDWRG